MLRLLSSNEDQAIRIGFGSTANQAIGGLLAKAGKAGVNLAAAPEIPLGIQIGGTVTNPVVKADVGSLTSSVKETTEQAVKQAVTQKVDSAALRLVAVSVALALAALLAAFVLSARQRRE